MGVKSETTAPDGGRNQKSTPLAHAWFGNLIVEFKFEVEHLERA